MRQATHRISKQLLADRIRKVQLTTLICTQQARTTLTLRPSNVILMLGSYIPAPHIGTSVYVWLLYVARGTIFTIRPSTNERQLEMPRKESAKMMYADQAEQKRRLGNELLCRCEFDSNICSVMNVLIYLHTKSYNKQAQRRRGRRRIRRHLR